MFYIVEGRQEMSREIEYISIGRVSRLMGTSSQMIREYERAGLIKSMRAENNYRQFIAPDLTYLLYYKTLRCLGFSTKDILELTAEIDKSRNMERLDAKYLEIEQQIKELQMKLSILGSKKVTDTKPSISLIVIALIEYL